jgi:UDP-2,3-diacylglucosamine hydrolase
VAAIFLSDAHLKSEDDPGYRDLLCFLERLLCDGEDKETQIQNVMDRSLSPVIRDVTDLYIVGDFFEFWFSKKERIYPGFKTVIDRLVALKNRGIKVHLCEGNHDFFLKDYFVDILDMSISEEFLTIDLDGKRVLISHGDTIDRTNKSYLLLRRLLRSKVIRFLKEWIPPPVLWGIARKSAELSKAAAREPKSRLVEKMHQAALEKFEEGFDAVILGHCHVPVLRESTMEGRKKTFVTLGDWIEHHSYLHYADGRFALSYDKPREKVCSCRTNP